MSSKLTAALEYLAKGWSVIPCGTHSKVALVNWRKYQKNRPTKEQVKAWWNKHPDANIAVITGRISGLIVVDVDTYKGGKTSEVPATGVIAKTARGGFHYFYRYPESESKVENATNIKPGIDVRADGGYVVVAPSYVVDKDKGYEGGYEWQQRERLGLAPKWVLKKESKDEDETFSGSESANVHSGKQKKVDKPSWLADMFNNGLREGSRNDSITRLAGYLYRQRIPHDVAIAIAGSLNRSSVSPLSQQEITTTVKSAYKSATRNSSKRSDPASDGDDKPKRFGVTRADAYARKYGATDTAWIVKEWLPEKTIAFAVAAPESYKTWLLFDIAISVATGVPFLGVPTEKTGPVIIIQQEDFTGQNVQRLQLIYANKHGKPKWSSDGETFTWEAPSLEGVPIYFHEENLLRFNDEGIMAGLEKTIKEVGAKLVLIDPLYSAADQGNYMADSIPHMMQLKKWRDKYGCTFFLFHHTKKSADSTGREGLWGSQFLNAFLETGWQMRRINENAKTRITVVRHFKAAQRPEQITLDFDINTKEGNYDYECTICPYDPEEAKVKKDEEYVGNVRDAILDHVRIDGSNTCSLDMAIAAAKASKSRVKKTIERLVEEGIFEPHEKEKDIWYVRE